MPTKKLTDCCDITTGKLDSNAAEANGLYPYFTCAPEPLRINTYAFNDDVIILAGNNASGNFHCQRFKGKFNAYQRTYVITAKPGYDIDFIFYNLLISLSHLKKISQGSQTKFLTMKMLDSFLIEDIDIDSQKLLVKALKDGDNLKKCLKDTSLAIEEMLNTLFKKYFLQLTASNGEPLGTKIVFNNDLEAKLPKGWSISTIGDIVNENEKSPIQVNQAAKSVGKVPFFTSGDDIYFIKEKLVDGPNMFLSTGGNAVINFYYGEAAYSTDTWSISASKYTYYLYFFVRCIIQRINDYFFTGSGLEHLQKDQFKEIKIHIPPDELIEKFNKIAEKSFKKISDNFKFIHEIETLNDFLLPLVMDGKITVKEKSSN